MIKIIFTLLLLLNYFQPEIFCQSNLFEQSTLLDSSQAYNLVNQCSRYAPIIDGSWNPSINQIEDLEDNISKISELSADSCCFIEEKVENVNDFIRQYVGIIINGKKFIYINAFPKNEFDNWPSNLKKPDWKTEPYMVCDGGPYFWGVVYNPITKKFQELAFNGVG